MKHSNFTMKYTSPQVTVMEIEAQHMLCLSVQPGGGTENFGMNSNTYNDSDFE